MVEKENCKDRRRRREGEQIQEMVLGVCMERDWSANEPRDTKEGGETGEWERGRVV